MTDAFYLERLESRLFSLDALPLEPPYSDFDLGGERPQGWALKEASVLVPLIARHSGLSLVLTRRSDAMPTHSGQIAFPGGKRQDEDRDAIATALREAHEEIGLDPAQVKVIGVSDPYETGTQFRVTPIVGIISEEARFVPDPREVDCIFEIPFAFLMNPDNHHHVEGQYNGQTRQFFAIPYQDYYIWGATAGMLRALYLRLST
ncbi:CoA pyrophosphatase [Candidatus Phycosocius spiralis]|uniref:Nudix hydrolase domain-containing protein n=1 Tax=Candidatus Phycosocius spiralis TaxID=2815099 RepID=A0ABQ4PV81_9PROT|nr:CoA pyrophosphatase [Candidatus Phycosocius spiralis]GIU66897.1 hypothetical protein PsB1_1051 [Candidatus Phycosocius spiralis]